MAAGGSVTVEFYGMARLRAGRAEQVIEARTVGDLLSAVEMACPGLKGLVQEDGRLSRHYLLSINGERFVNQVQEPIQAGTHVVLLSADAGG